MSNRQERRNSRMTKRLLNLFGKDYTITWQGHHASLNPWSEGQTGPSIHVSFIGNRYHVKATSLNFEWRGDHLPTAAKQLKLTQMLGGDHAHA